MDKTRQLLHPVGLRQASLVTAQVNRE
jgi:hypothetical protein